MLIKLMSYNTQHCMNYLTRKIDFDLIADTIARCGGDIIGLQEIRGKGSDSEYQEQTALLAEKLGFYGYFAKAIDFGGGNPYGNAILSRFPIRQAETVLIPDPQVRKGNKYYETRCILKALIDVGAGLHVCVTHFGLNFDEQENAVRTVLLNLDEERCVLMGDFNLSPDDPILAPIRERMYDTAERFPGDLLSYPSDRPQIKIDYIFTSRDLRVTDADIPPIISSDHRPHIAKIDF